MTTLQTYTVLGDDSMQSVAMRALGDATRWPDIAQLNRLRAPYVSTQLTDQLGPAYSTITLQADLPAGSTTLPWSGPTGDFGVGNILCFSGDTDGDQTPECVMVAGVTPDGAGGWTVAIVRVLDYQSSTRRLSTSVGGTLVDHASGTAAIVVLPPTLLSTVVARPGDTLALPVLSTDTGISSTDPNAAIIDALGVDLALDPAGRLRDDGTGRLALVAGVPNLKQALAQIATTDYGEQVGRPTMGNPYQQYVAQNTLSDIGMHLMRALLTEAYMRDARIHSVERVLIRPAFDTMYVDVYVSAAPDGTAVNTGTLAV